MAQAPQTSPARPSASMGTSPAGLRARNSGRRSHTGSAASANSSPFSASARRSARLAGDSGRWWRTRMGGLYSIPPPGGGRWAWRTRRAPVILAP